MSDNSRETTTNGQEAIMSTQSTDARSTSTRRDLTDIPAMVPVRPDTAAERNIQRYYASQQAANKK